jgi:hypothetical protein
VALREMGLQGMVSLRADLAEAGRGEEGHRREMPGRRAVSAGKAATVAWMSPDELLILCDHGAADTIVAELAKALKGQHHLAVNVSDARAMFALTGEPGPCGRSGQDHAGRHGRARPGRDAPHAAAAGARRDLVRKRDRGARGLLPLGGAYVFDLLALRFH